MFPPYFLPICFLLALLCAIPYAGALVAMRMGNAKLTYAGLALTVYVIGWACLVVWEWTGKRSAHPLTRAPSRAMVRACRSLHRPPHSSPPPPAPLPPSLTALFPTCASPSQGDRDAASA